MAITDPEDITSCVMWLDTSSISATDGDSISSWSDSTSNGNNATITAGDEPVYRDGSSQSQYFSKAELVYESNADRIATPATSDMTTGNTWSYAFRIRPIILYTGNLVWWVHEQRNSGQAWSMLWDPTALTFGDSRLSCRGRLSTGSFVNDTSIDSAMYPCQHFVLVTYDGSNMRFYVDDWANPISTLAMASIRAGGSGDRVYLGTNPTVDTGSSMSAFGDVVCYDKVLSSGERTDLLGWYHSEWGEESGRATYKGGLNDTAYHNIPDGYRTASIKLNPNGTHFDMVCAKPADNTVHWFQASASDPHNWTHQNSGSAIFSPGFECRGISHLWFGGSLLLYYENRTLGNVYKASGTGFTTLSDDGILFTGSAGKYYRHPFAWERDSKVFLLLDIRTDSPGGEAGHIVCTNSSDGETSWAADHTIISPRADETGLSDDIGAPSLLELANGDLLISVIGYNKDYKTNHPGYPHSIWLGTLTDPMTDTLTLVGEGGINQGRIGTSPPDCYAGNSAEFYDRRAFDGLVEYYVDGQGSGSVIEMVVYQDTALTLGKTFPFHRYYSGAV